MNHRELRRTFLEFYTARGHKIVPSAPLVPKDDPSLLFTGAGMVQFKPYFAGTVEPPYRRAVCIQKCLRASDLDQVGRTSRHGTFFEMMGNFSFGDYFKEDGIQWAWEYLTEVAKLDPERLFPTVLDKDDEAFRVWHQKVGLPENRITRLGAEDNFWGPIGGGGACGPDSEIFYDLGEEYGCGKASCGPGCDCDRFGEVYNVVFPEFNQLPDGTREPLKNRGVDTGMGMERLAMASQGRKTIFDTDLFAPLVSETSRILDIEITDDNRSVFRVAADHTRALTFAIADGVIPSNEARGYVLRGILRRALLFAHRLGVKEPFLYRLSGAVVEHMRQWYPELVAKREQAAMMIKSEEERFLNTLDAGLERWQDVLKKHWTDRVIPGEDLFKLHDTFGFHIELVKELAEGEDVKLDTEGFEQAMAGQRERSKKKSTSGIEFTATVEFTRESWHDQDRVETEVETEIDQFKIAEDDIYEVHLKEMPFYPESGGQVGDTGKVEGSDFTLEVLNCYRSQGVPVIKARLVKGEVATGLVTATVDRERRREIERAHTATHLLHAALREVVGDYVKQEGSLVEPGRLRFDFTAFEPLAPEQLYKVEDMVYEQVIANRKLERRPDVPFEEAKKLGALAFFGEQYGDKVTVVNIPGFSMELCGGTHLRSTGEIGMFVITSETGVAAGIRRIDAVVGRAAHGLLSQVREHLDRVSGILGTGPEALVQRVEKLIEDARHNENRLQQMTARVARGAATEFAAKFEVIGGVKAAVGYMPQFKVDDLRLVADGIRERLGKSYAGFLAGAVDGKRLSYIIFISPDLEQKLPAGKLAKVVGKALGGGGGGRPSLASGGGEVDRLSEGQDAFRAALTDAAEQRD
jgi:alanyl-tRNA synthetase